MGARQVIGSSNMATRGAACVVGCWAALAAGCGFVAQGMNADGVRMQQQGQVEQAQHRFRQALAADPKNADAYYNLAASYHQLGKSSGRVEELAQAESLYHQCLVYNPDHVDCHRALAVLLVERNRTDEAFQLLDGWAMRSPTLADPRIELARLWEESKDPQKAKDQLYAALSADPYSARALTALGRLHEQAGNYSQALADYQRSLVHDSLQPEVAARVAALRSAFSGHPISTPPGGTRTVQQGTPAYR